ncbi:MAG: TrkA family potassium uptake protein [Firmicutes bacterium]|nr:TrkA family potassium uptake protein [Bacillota bacterium]MBQ4371644.1 TrkA family potassium uptake protein [Bacillota bacterium]
MKSVLLIGLNHLGSMLAAQFQKLGHEVLAVDIDEERVNNILPYVTDAQIGDSTNEIFLRSLGINNFDVCFVTIGEDFQSSLETTSLLKELGGKLVVSRAESEVQEKFLLRNGADEVINPEKQIAEWAAMTYSSERILDYIKLDDEHTIFEVSMPAEWAGKTVSQIDVRRNYGINIMGVKKNGKLNISIEPDTLLESDMTMLVLSDYRNIQRVFKL